MQVYFSDREQYTRWFNGETVSVNTNKPETYFLKHNIEPQDVESFDHTKSQPSVKTFNHKNI